MNNSASRTLVVSANPAGDNLVELITSRIANRIADRIATVEKPAIGTATGDATAGTIPQGAGVTTLDLTALDYPFVMTEADRRAYHTETPIVDDQVRQHADLLLESDTLVFIYSVVWGTLPALLKGWIDRTLVLGVALTLQNGKVKRNLTQVRKIVGVAVANEEATWGKSGGIAGRDMRDILGRGVFGRDVFGDGGKRFITRTLPMITHPLVKRKYLQHRRLYNPDTQTSQDIQANQVITPQDHKFLHEVAKVLQMPKLVS